jgi:metallo-beta-lactamase class B
MLRHVMLVAAAGAALKAQMVPPVAATDPVLCSNCRAWNRDHAPSRLFGNVYYVGTDGLSSILLTSANGHVLIDGALPESAPVIAEHIRQLGFSLSDVKVILNSHAHFDHAGGIAALQKASGARVVVSPEAAPVLRTGRDPDSDPQHGLVLNYTGSDRVDAARDRGTVIVGNIVLTMHATAGHMPGGTSWSWRSCEKTDCLDFVYADSQTPVSNDTFLYSKNTVYPNALDDFEKGFRYLESAKCDVLITPHPGASSLFERMSKGRAGLVNPEACREYAATARRALAERLTREKGR